METPRKMVVLDAMLRQALSVQQSNIPDLVSTPLRTPVKTCTRPLVCPAPPRKGFPISACIAPWIGKAVMGRFANVETARGDAATVPVPSPQTPQKTRPLMVPRVPGDIGSCLC
ncbi:hypothetical protein M422DRAFT_65609 [Sphaerobolus stellatus SS14]|nr:hypothetical protein M422DRAFT_65609 [Sphaerobolus stellatus SS14]